MIGNIFADRGRRCDDGVLKILTTEARANLSNVEEPIVVEHGLHRNPHCLQLFHWPPTKASRRRSFLVESQGGFRRAFCLVLESCLRNAANWLVTLGYFWVGNALVAIVKHRQFFKLTGLKGYSKKLHGIFLRSVGDLPRFLSSHQKTVLRSGKRIVSVDVTTKSPRKLIAASVKRERDKSIAAMPFDGFMPRIAAISHSHRPVRWLCQA